MIKKGLDKKEVVLKFLKLSKKAELPEYAFATDAGFDLKAIEDVTFFPLE